MFFLITSAKAFIWHLLVLVLKRLEQENQQLLGLLTSQVSDVLERWFPFVGSEIHHPACCHVDIHTLVVRDRLHLISDASSLHLIQVVVRACRWPLAPRVPPSASILRGDLIHVCISVNHVLEKLLVVEALNGISDGCLPHSSGG